ncbi:MAG: ABC transporter permease [Myxococcales bacterium]|nr:ABC transporter permease [Myxococcales bacterium]
MVGTLLWVALRSLRQHTVRSLLTLLSIGIGCFGIVSMTSLAESGFASLEKSIEEMGGARLLMFVPKRPERAEARASSFSLGLTRVDRDRALSDLAELDGATLLATLGRREVVSDAGLEVSTDLVAADAAFFDLFRMRVAEGRAFTEAENLGRAPVCVIGHKTAERLWPGSAVGHWLVAGALRCRVIGVFADNDRFGLSFGFEWTDLLVVPHETGAVALPEARSAAMILAKTRQPSENEHVKRVVNARLVERHHGVDDFTIYDFSSVMARFHALFTVLEVIVALVAAVALVIGGVGVMNMLLVSVTERVREIGVRKALGARPADIAAQFAAEALALSGLGGTLGAVAGVLVAGGSAILIRRALPGWVPVTSWVAVGLALASALGIGAVFGWAPSRRAARLDPVEALRG